MTELEQLKTELTKLKSRYKLLLKQVEYWEATGLESSIDELQNRIWRLEHD